MKFKSWLENFQKYKIFPKLNSHNMADTFGEELMIAMLLLRNIFAWSPLEGNKKKTKKTKKGNNCFGWRTPPLKKHKL